MKRSHLPAAAILAAGFFLFSLLPDAALAASKKNQPIISRITIRGTDIFDFETNTALRKFPYTTINALHIQTKEEVIRRELLFQVGEPLDPFLLRETERNLRALSFIRAARVAKFPQRDGTVALVVHVNDSWTTEPQINLGGVNKVDTTEFGFKEKNLFGYGKNVGVFYKEGDNYSQREYTYTDPRLLGTRWQLKGKVISKTGEHSRNLALERPFYAADTKWSARGMLDHNVATLDEFANNAVVSRFEQKKETGEVAGAIKVGGGRDLVNHAGLRYQKINRNFKATSETNPSRPIPQHDDIQTFFVDMDSARSNFVEMTHLEKMTRVEDVNLGPIFRMSPGYSPGSLNSTGKSYTQFETVFEKKFLSANQNMLQTRFAYGGRNTFHNGENQTYEIQIKNYHPFGDFQTLVVNTRANWGDNLDPDRQFKLGGNNGLRAFKDDSIAGTKSWVLNIEDRFYLTDEILNLFSIGAVLFYDTGFVWSRSRPVSSSKLKSDIGAGLRFGLTRSSNEVIVRLDLSYRPQRIKSSDSKFVVSFGTDQAF